MRQKGVANVVYLQIVWLVSVYVPSHS